MLSFIIWCLKKHPLVVENVITIIFLAKIPWRFAWEDRSEIKFLHFFIDNSMETPIATTRTILEFNEIVVTSFKEFPEFVRDGCWINLIEV